MQIISQHLPTVLSLISYQQYEQN